MRRMRLVLASFEARRIHHPLGEGLEMGKIVELNRDYIRGIHSAKMAVATGDVYDIDDALYMFRVDPADTEFQRGYHAGLVQVYRQQKGLDQ